MGGDRKGSGFKCFGLSLEESCEAQIADADVAVKRVILSLGQAGPDEHENYNDREAQEDEALNAARLSWQVAESSASSPRLHLAQVCVANADRDTFWISGCATIT